MSDKYESLKIENQLCFPLYACSKEIIRRYNPILEKLDLTYTQYITMLVLWEKKSLNVKTLGECLFLDSGTLTPVLKKLEAKGLLTRERCKEDERLLNVNITQSGLALRDIAVEVPQKMKGCINLEPEEARMLYKILYKMLEEF
ncbi:MarR family winged helix-turn-helix transcriptional regulator [Lachnobacterium bovis]|uniref:DNA-binding transcriptional regulator, MarR family n=1 Tax=Lachnobacterium bovis TaxID=140626 RepID=A0A1H9RT17_9FIRM|nr:MarR family transcriptional regulator [Lachnobacterium bovis]SER75283.1 DNA-binding transcriptional regulator, MarR family [Lachnobacterium bovis]